LPINQYEKIKAKPNIRVQMIIGVNKQLNEQRHLNFVSQPNSNMIVLKATVIKDVTKKLVNEVIKNLINKGTDYPVKI
jgi:hypothetical protein